MGATRAMVTLLAGVMMACQVDPEQVLAKAKADAIAGVTAELAGTAAAESLPLRTQPNPWGSGLIVFTANAEKRDEIAVWLFWPDLRISIPSTPRQHHVVAFGDNAARLTPRVARFQQLDDDAKRASGLHAVSEGQVFETVGRAINDGTAMTRLPLAPRQP